jgi:hypothetical protein
MAKKPEATPPTRIITPDEKEAGKGLNVDI